jgi:hypothetical protein
MMDTGKPYLRAIAANLMALRAILATAIQDVDHGMEAAEQQNQNGAVGSIIPTEGLLNQAAILLQAITVLHRQS